MIGNHKVFRGVTPWFSEYQFIPPLQMWLTSICLYKGGFIRSWTTITPPRLGLTWVQTSRTYTTDWQSGPSGFGKLKKPVLTKVKCSGENVYIYYYPLKRSLQTQEGEPIHRPIMFVSLQLDKNLLRGFYCPILIICTDHMDLYNPSKKLIFIKIIH